MNEPLTSWVSPSPSWHTEKEEEKEGKEKKEGKNKISFEVMIERKKDVWRTSADNRRFDIVYYTHTFILYINIILNEIF